MPDLDTPNLASALAKLEDYRIIPRWLLVSEAVEDYIDQSERQARNRQLSPMISRLQKAWASYFRKQGAWWITNHLTATGIAEAAKPLPHRSENALRQLETYSAEAVAALTLELTGRSIELGGSAGYRMLGLEGSFDLANPRAVTYMRARAAELVAGINATSRDQLRTLLTEAIDNGWSYGKMASAIRRLFADFGRSRALMIARTELGNAYTEATAIVGRDLYQNGVAVEKRWIAIQDQEGEPCLLNAEEGWIPMMEPFQSGDQQPLQHPNCRCALVVRRMQ